MSAPAEAVRLAPLTMADLKRLVEASTLATAVAIFDAKLVRNPSRSGRRLYADVKGTAANPYAVVIDLLGEGRDIERSRCSCPAAKFQGVRACKHGAAVLVAWASAPGSFAEVAAGVREVEEAQRARKKRAGPKKGRADPAEQIRKGIASLEALLGELAHTGLGTLTAERVEQIREVAKNLRPLGLRRLAPACMELAALLDQALMKDGEFSTERYARTIATLVFHVRGLNRLIERTDADAEDYRRLADELLGRTWTEKSLTGVAGLRLLDLCFRRRETADRFVLEESVLVDVATGDLFVDKAIRPIVIAKREPPKEDFGHALLEVADAGLYPGYAPRRIRLRSFERRTPTAGDILSLLGKVPDSVDAVMAGLRTQVADVFAPRPMLGLLRPVHLLVDAGRVYAVDRADKALSLRIDEIGLDVLERALEPGPALLLLGNLDLAQGGPEMRPLAVATGTAQRPTFTSFPEDGSP